jgi:anti-sigma B factor antagonist
VHLSSTAESGATVVTASGELDIGTAAQLRQHLHDVLDKRDAPLILDLTDVQFIDSTVLGVLVSVHKRLVERGHVLTLVSPHERLLRIFRLTVLDRVFAIVPALPGATPSTE